MLNARDLTIHEATSATRDTEYLAIDEHSLAMLREEGLTDDEILAFLRVDTSPEYTREVTALKLMLGENLPSADRLQAA